jgi:ABC-type antimicrobial peptide transport system permease subunit
MNTVVVGLFAVLSLMLATIGIYGVVAYAVTQRTREIGLRIALGATRGQVLALILRRGLGLTLVGVALGVAASLVITRLLANRLYEVRATDPGTFIVVAVLLMTISLLASYIAARRAVRLDPMVALRYE